MNKSVVELVFPANSYTSVWEQHHKNSLPYRYNYLYQLKTGCAISEIILLTIFKLKLVYFTSHHVTIYTRAAALIYPCTGIEVFITAIPYSLYATT